jgi:hypothetical protein
MVAGDKPSKVATSRVVRSGEEFISTPASGVGVPYGETPTRRRA